MLKLGNHLLKRKASVKYLSKHLIRNLINQQDVKNILQKTPVAERFFVYEVENLSALNSLIISYLQYSSNIAVMMELTP